MILLPDWAVLNAAIDWLAHGVLNLSWWQMVLVTLAMTHITIVSVTIFLHRHQAHRALDLHPIASHFFRFWLWLTTGRSPRSGSPFTASTTPSASRPRTRTARTCTASAKCCSTAPSCTATKSQNLETLARYGHGTPGRLDRAQPLHPLLAGMGVGLMMVIDLVLFGAAGLAVWAVQMAWIPIMAAGIINGAAHYWGYRNFEAPDASTNISPWGIIIGGEELHNNHHTYPTSAKLSVKPYEFDIGWMYISLMQKVGLANGQEDAAKAGVRRYSPGG